MAERPERGDRGEVPGRAQPRRVRCVAGVGVMLLVLGLAAMLAYDHRRADLSAAWTTVSDGRVASVDSSGFSGPRSVVVVGPSTVTMLPVPPVLRHSTSTGPSRGPGGLALSPSGWVLMRLGELGRDTEGGELTEISPSGSLLVTLPLLHWRDTRIIGITDQGLAVFRTGPLVSLLGPDGEGVPLLDVRRLGVTRDLSNLADVALAADGRLAVLVGDGTAPDGYRLFERHPGGAAHRVVRIAGAQLVDPPAAGGPRQRQVARPVVAFAGEDIAVAGNAGVVRLHDGRVQARVRVTSADRPRMPLTPSTLVALSDGRWMVGHHRLVVLDASGHLHHPGYGPCPTEPHLRRACPAVMTGHRLPRPADVLPAPAMGTVGIGLLVLTWAGRLGRTEGTRLRLAATVCGATWVTLWLATCLAWGDLHGSPPLLLLGGAMMAILAPAFPTVERQVRGNSAEVGHRSDQPWVTDRIIGPNRAGGGAKRLEVVPLPSRS